MSATEIRLVDPARREKTISVREVQRADAQSGDPFALVRNGANGSIKPVTVERVTATRIVLLKQNCLRQTEEAYRKSDGGKVGEDFYFGPKLKPWSESLASKWSARRRADVSKNLMSRIGALRDISGVPSDQQEAVFRLLLDAEALLDPDPAERDYYILDARDVVGNCASWWMPDGNGYTCNLDDAGLFTLEQASAERSSDVPVHRSIVRKIGVRHVRVDHLREHLGGTLRLGPGGGLS